MYDNFQLIIPIICTDTVVDHITRTEAQFNLENKL